MWFLLLYLQISAIQGLNVNLRGSKSPCEGRLEVYRENKWGLVCHYGWRKTNGEVVCRSLGCGDHIHSGIEQTHYKDPTPPQHYWMDQVKCTSEEKSLWNCKHVGKNNQKCDDGSFVAVKCSGTVTLSLNLNGHRNLCAGVVEFSTHEDTFGVCNDKWGKDEANKVCKELNCGEHFSMTNAGWLEEQSKQNVLLTCTGDEKFSWQCMARSECTKRASVTCTNHRKFRLRDDSDACSGLVEEYIVKQNSWNPLQQKKERPEVICTQLNCGSTGNFTNKTNRLTCSGSVKLNNFTTKCFGDVSINVNGTNYGVCYSSNQALKNMGAVVCRELGCGNVVHVQQGSGSSYGFLSNVECKGDELSLWHCLAYSEKKQCQGTKVICSDSLDVRLSDGLGRCSGRLEVKWEGLWRPVGSNNVNNVNDMMCGHLNCGTSSQINRELFVEGEQQLWLWNVKCSSSAKLHECFKNINLMLPRNNEKYIQIICTKEELKFFEGNSACKGKVYIVQFDSARTPKYLPPMEKNDKKAGEICNAMHCGSLDSVDSKTDAYVTCSGSNRVEPRVALQNLLGEKCWGQVKVCGDECGGVCSKTWRKDDSKMICESLGCGNPIENQNQNQLQSKKDLRVTYHSVYCSEKVKNMTMCNFVSNQKSTCKSPAEVICTDSVKVKLQDPRDKCAGTVSLFYAGDWTPICQDDLNENLKNTICKELLCGTSVNDQHDRTSHEESTQGLLRITCQDSYNSVSKCDLNQVSPKTCTAGYLKCTGRERLLLYEKEGECSGPVYCLKDGNTQQVSGIGWSREEGQNLCEYLQCGNYISHSPVFNDTKEQWKKTYNFSGNNKIWECRNHNASVQNQPQLNIQCDRKPTNIMLTNNCTGTVLVDNEPVCASQWDDGMSNKLCDSLNCGKALYRWSPESTTKTLRPNVFHFGCTGKETLVWQCGFKRSSCDNILNVTCEGSVHSEFRTTEKCGGKIGIRYKEKWQYVCGELKKDHTKMFCDVLKCNDSQQLLDEQEVTNDINVQIDCPNTHYDISHCLRDITAEKCTRGRAEIICDGYIPKDGRSSVGLILGLLGGLLGLLILFLIWINRQRLLLALSHYRNKNRKEVKPDVNEMDKMDTKNKDLSEEKTSFLDNDDYQDVDSLKDKSGQENEEDDRKRGSSGTEYDDVEGQANGISTFQTHHDDDINLPLLPRRPENILDQDTYEVEIEKQDDYDDVISVEGPANENGGKTGTQAHEDEDEGADSDFDAGLVENADAVFVSTEVEVHTPPEE